MDRLAQRTELGVSIDKHEDCPTCSICWNCDIASKDCRYIDDALNKLAEYEDLEDNGLLLPSKDKLINALAEIALNSEFGRCYMCTNSMKNITLDGVNNGCDGNCGHEEFTTDDLIKKVAEELRHKSEAEQKLKEMEGNHGIAE